MSFAEVTSHSMVEVIADVRQCELGQHLPLVVWLKY